MASKAIEEFDNVRVEDKQPFLYFNKEALKRPGVILRLLSILVFILGVVLALVLPTISIDYATYSNTTSFSSARAARFPTEFIDGWASLFGGGMFSYYLKSTSGPEILNTSVSSFNGILFGVLIFGILIAVLSFLVIFSKKLEKFSKLVVLGFVVTGIGFLFSPVFFLSINRFGNNYYVSVSDKANYFVYDSLYCHCAFGAIVSCLVFVISAVLFGIGTNLENAGAEDRK